MKMITHYIYPPIPDRRFDWSCIDYDTYDGPGSIIGYGATEQEAIDDWHALREERDECQAPHVVSDDDYERGAEDAQREDDAKQGFDDE